jgi:hypothetical protein
MRGNGKFGKSRGVLPPTERGREGKKLTRWREPEGRE